MIILNVVLKPVGGPTTASADWPSLRFGQSAEAVVGQDHTKKGEDDHQ